MPWHREKLAGFDLKTTGTDVRDARIVTAADTEARDGEPLWREWLLRPDLSVTDGPTVRHDIAAERVAVEGRQTAEAAAEIARALVEHQANGVPTVGYGSPFRPRAFVPSQVFHAVGAATGVLR